MTDYTSEKRLAELERLADAATDGGDTWRAAIASGHHPTIVGAAHGPIADCMPHHAAHIAANDPAQVRALVAEIRRLRGLLRPFPPACDDLDTRITEAINKRRGEVERRKMVDPRRAAAWLYYTAGIHLLHCEEVGDDEDAANDAFVKGRALGKAWSCIAAANGFAWMVGQ